jgi:hypothetical protein
MKPSWPEFPKGKDSNVTTPEKGKQVEDVVVAEIDYEDQHLQSAALLKEVAGKYDAWLAAKGVAEGKRGEMLSRKELVEGFAREELGIYL